jgi:hypothetical protein
MIKEKRICTGCGSEDVALGSGGVLRVPDEMLTSEPEWFCKKCHHVASLFPVKIKTIQKQKRSKN